MSVLKDLQRVIWANAPFAAASPGGLIRILLQEGVKLPATTYQVAGGSSEPTFDTSGPQKTRLQFDFHADTADAAEAAQWALREFIEGYSGLLPGGAYVTDVEWIQDIDNFDDEPRRVRLVSEYYVYFNFSS